MEQSSNPADGEALLQTAAGIGKAMLLGGEPAVVAGGNVQTSTLGDQNQKISDFPDTRFYTEATLTND